MRDPKIGKRYRSLYGGDPPELSPVPPVPFGTEARAWTTQSYEVHGNKRLPPAYSGGEAPHLLYSRAVLTIYDSGPKVLAPTTLCTHSVPEVLKSVSKKLGEGGEKLDSTIGGASMRQH